MTDGARRLEGFGAGLVREAALAARVQAGLERLYRIEPVAQVEHYLQVAPDGERESVLVREADGAVELRVHVPALGARALRLDDGAALDPLCQLIEGVSHFVLLTQRAHAAAQVTQLELELQAEVDKFVVLGASVPSLDVARSEVLRGALYHRVQYAHDVRSEEGARYRLANRLADRFVRALSQQFLPGRQFAALQAALRRFFHASREDKLRLAQAA